MKKISKLTGCDDEELLEILLAEAESTILAYTNRTVLPSALNSVAVRLVVVNYKRMGTEGETSHSEGGISTSFSEDIPKEITSVLNKYRLVRCGGNVFENESD
jgi:uncharacterized protein YerC